MQAQEEFQMMQTSHCTPYGDYLIMHTFACLNHFEGELDAILLVWWVVQVGQADSVNRKFRRNSCEMEIVFGGKACPAIVVLVHKSASYAYLWLPRTTSSAKITFGATLLCYVLFNVLLISIIPLFVCLWPVPHLYLREFRSRGAGCNTVGVIQWCKQGELIVLTGSCSDTVDSLSLTLTHKHTFVCLSLTSSTPSMRPWPRTSPMMLCFSFKACKPCLIWLPTCIKFTETVRGEDGMPLRLGANNGSFRIQASYFKKAAKGCHPESQNSSCCKGTSHSCDTLTPNL